MFTVSMICMCLVCLIILCGLAGLICFIGSQTENLGIVFGAMVLAFFVGHVVLSFMFTMLTEAYGLPQMPWQVEVK